jgi:hypothetical protein
VRKGFLDKVSLKKHQTLDEQHGLGRESPGQKELLPYLIGILIKSPNIYDLPYCKIKGAGSGHA